MDKFIKEIPKVDLHCHLDGSVRVETMYELLLEQGDLEDIGLEGFKKLVMVNDDNDSLIEYLKKFDYPVRVMQTENNLERITYELLEDMSKENLMYVEIRFAPYLHMEKGLDFDQILNSIIKGMNRAMVDFPIKANLIIIGMRHENPELTMELVEKGEKFLNKGVVAVDLAGNEADFPPEIHKKAILKAKDLGYKISLHAGETGSVENIWTAIDEMYADRIGHGIAAIKEEKIMKELSKRRIALEMCPTSNLQTKAVDSLDEYPIRSFMDKDMCVTVNTDNTTVSNTNINKEYKLLVDELGFTKEDIIKTIENSIESSFLDKLDKDGLKDKLEKY